MKIIELKTAFHKALNNKYQKNEIDSFFYLLSEAYANLKRVDIALDPNKEINLKKTQSIQAALEQLKKDMPIQYILGTTEFHGLNFNVNESVLIPRPETEELVNWILKVIQEKNLNKKELKILDIGTGSGCIPITLAKNISNSNIWALDLSKKALKIAKSNAELNQVNITFLEKDILKTSDLKEQFDIIVSNPPYVTHLEKKLMQKNVLSHEPHLALFVEDDEPLIFYDKIADIALKNLKPHGYLFFEINQAFGKETMQLLKEKNFKNIELKKDVFGVDRMIKCEVN